MQKYCVSTRFWSRRFIMQLARLSTVFFLLIVSVAVTAQSPRSSDFALLDQHGSFHQLSRYVGNDAVVVLSYARGDSASALAARSFNELKRSFTASPISFFLLDSNVEPNKSELISELQALGVDLPVLIDSAQVVAKSLGIRAVTEAVILEPESHDILYRGPLNRVDAALRAILSGAIGELEDIAMPEASALEFVYEDAIAEQGLSYQEDIAPIFAKRCAYCHVDGGLAPWAMSSYRMLQGWSPMVREVLLTRRMPPGQIDMSVGHWTGINEIEDEELAKLISWIDSGARRQGDGDPIAELSKTTDGAAQSESWVLGEPDLIVDVPTQSVPATGVVDFRYEYAELSLAEDKWVSAIAYDVGDKSVLHSLMVFALEPGTSTASAENMVRPDNADFMSIFVPGHAEDEYAPDAGFLLKAGHDLAFKIRYVSSGRETSDTTRVGLYFRNKPQMQVMHVPIFRDDISVKAGNASQREIARALPLERDAFIEAIAPQMHGRGVGMRLSLSAMGAPKQEIINVANYNFNWQLNYALNERLPMAAGSVLEAVTIYNNSESNVYNPDPEADAHYGVTTWDEILSHYVRAVVSLSD